MRKFRPSGRARLTGLLALLCCVALLVGSLAFFTDYIRKDTGGDAGDIDLVFTDISASKTGTNGIQSKNEFAVDKAWSGAFISGNGVTNPGDVFDLSYTLANNGSKSMDVCQQLVVTSSQPMTLGAEEYQLTITGGRNATKVPGVLSNDRKTITYDLQDVILDGSDEKETGALTNTQFTVQLQYLRDAKNAFMDSGVTISYKAQAKQHRNTDPNDWVSWTAFESSYEQIGENLTSGLTLFGSGQTFDKGKPMDLKFRAFADMEDLQEVQVNGETVNPAYYVVNPGSSVITVPAQVLRMLPNGEYEVAVVFTNGTATGSFTVTGEGGGLTGNTYIMYYEGEPVSAMLFVDESNAYLFNTNSAMFIPCTYRLNGLQLVGSVMGETMTAMLSDDLTTITVDGTGETFVLSNEILTFDEEYAYLYIDAYMGYVGIALDNTKPSYSPISALVNNKPVIVLMTTYAGNTNLVAAPAIPEGVMLLGETFYNCTNLQSVILPSTIMAVDDAFYGCENLTDIYYAGTKVQWENISGIDDEDLAGVNIHYESSGPEVLTGVAGNAYTQMYDGYPVGILCLAEDGSAYAFGLAGQFFVPGTYTLDGLTLSGSIMGNPVTGTVSADYRKITAAGYQEPFICRNDVVTFDEEYAYIYSSGVGYAALSLDLTKSSFGAIPATVKGKPVIGLVNTFYGNSNMTAAPSIPEGITVLQGTFYGCTGLQSVTLPASVQAIDDNTFYGCMSLTDVYFAGSESQWNNISISGTGNEFLQNATIHFAG